MTTPLSRCRVCCAHRWCEVVGYAPDYKAAVPEVAEFTVIVYAGGIENNVRVDVLLVGVGADDESVPALAIKNAFQVN